MPAVFFVFSLRAGLAWHRLFMKVSAHISSCGSTGRRAVPCRVRVRVRKYARDRVRSQADLITDRKLVISTFLQQCTMHW